MRGETTRQGLSNRRSITGCIHIVFCHQFSGELDEITARDSGNERIPLLQ